MNNNKNNWLVYKHINKVNGKVYIGKTSKKPEYRWNEGKGYKYNPHFWNAINYYGWDNFDHVIVKRNLTKEESTALERQLIRETQSMDPKYGYNNTAGGEGMLGWHHTPTSLAKIKHSNSVRGVSQKTREKMSKVMKEKYQNQDAPFKGKHHSEANRKYIGTIATRRWQNPEYRKKMLKALGSEERRKLLSDRRKEQWKDPEYRNRMVSILQSDEYKEKVSKAHTGHFVSDKTRRLMSQKSKGVNNGMYGRHGKDNPNSKPVVQYDINGNKLNEYVNATEASMATGVNNASIGLCCKRKLNTSGGYIWRYVGDNDVSLPDVRRRQKEQISAPVYQFDLDANFIERFENINEVKSKYSRFSRYRILDVCKGYSESAYGYIWSFHETVSPFVFHSSMAREVLKFSISGEFLRRFRTAIEAANEVFNSPSNIGACCSGKAKTASGFLYIYADEYSDEILRRRVQEIEYGKPKKEIMMFTMEGDFLKIFESAMAAEKETGISSFVIYGCCTGDTNTAGNHIFLYKNDYSKELLEKRVQRLIPNNYLLIEYPISMLSDDEYQLLKVYKQNPYITQPKAAKEIKKSTKTVWRINRSLKEKRVLMRVGSEVHSYWKTSNILDDSLFNPLG